jgi:PAS domain S-box-containing protein
MTSMLFSARRFRDLSIRGKVMLVTCTASIVAVFAVAGGLYLFQLRNFRHSFQRELDALAQIMADNCAPALAFDDAKTASEVLAPLTAKPEIQRATVLGKDGREFAVFGQKISAAPPAPDAAAGIVDRGASWTVVQPIVLDGERIGTFALEADYAGPRGALQRLFLGVTAAVLAGSIGLVVLLTLRLQDFITRPIRRLASASEAVASNHDYSVRVEASGKDELGQLTAAFNQMLARIEEQDGALRLAEVKFRGLVEQLPAITYHAGLGATCKWTYVSPQIHPLLGFTPEEWLASDGLWFEHIHPDDRDIPLEAEAVALSTGRMIAEYRMFTRGGEVRWFRDQAVYVPESGQNAAALYGVMLDITEAKAGEVRLADLNKQLVDSSRMAGMAEVATGVLHNVGNVLNSVNIAASIALEKLRASKVEGLRKATALLAEHEHDLGAWLTSDPQGQRLPGYLRKLATILAEENAAVIGELDALGKNVEHIKEIVAMQQSYARVTGVLEDLPPERLVEDALQLNATSFNRHGIEIVRDFRPAPPVRVDKHKVLQILINLLRNAKHAVEDAGRRDGRIAVTIDTQAGLSRITIADNGVGIAPENLTQVFRHGFTTKKHGHGFGLHSGANAAKEMGGSISADSAGPGHGATFTLALPTATVSPHA